MLSERINRCILLNFNSFQMIHVVTKMLSRYNKLTIADDTTWERPIQTNAAESIHKSMPIALNCSNIVIQRHEMAVRL